MKKRGGKRPGAGRKKLIGKVPLSCSLTHDEMERLDNLRGTKSRGRFLAQLILAHPVSPFEKFRLSMLSKRTPVSLPSGR